VKIVLKMRCLSSEQVQPEEAHLQGKEDKVGLSLASSQFCSRRWWWGWQWV